MLNSWGLLLFHFNHDSWPPWTSTTASWLRSSGTREELSERRSGMCWKFFIRYVLNTAKFTLHHINSNVVNRSSSVNVSLSSHLIVELDYILKEVQCVSCCLLKPFVWLLDNYCLRSHWCIFVFASSVKLHSSTAWFCIVLFMFALT